jgi:1-acyl-sn-glycerol-3-phosphate acyltransferase
VRRVAEVGYGLAVLGLAVLTALVSGTLIALPFGWMRRGPRERVTVLAGAVFGWVVVRVLLLARPVVRGSVELPPGQGALVLCNHRSWLDPMVLLAWTSANGLSKREILYLPVIGFYGWLTGAVYFDRRSKAGRARAREEVLHLLRSGCRVALFPEGTRSRDGRLREKVYLRLVHDCYDEGIPVVPCAVWASERALPVDRAAAVPGQRFYLERGPVHWPAEHESAERFAEACWRGVVERVQALEREAG